MVSEGIAAEADTDCGPADACSPAAEPRPAAVVVVAPAEDTDTDSDAERTPSACETAAAELMGGQEGSREGGAENVTI